MFNEQNIHTVKVHWSYPIKLENIENSVWKDFDGLYYISRQVGFCPEKVIYIGETKRTFRKRLEEHKRDRSRWTQKNGQKYVRFGTLEYRYAPEYDRKKLLRCVESAIIQNIMDDHRCQLTNISQTKSADVGYRLKIINEGYRGVLSSEPIIFDSDDVLYQE